MLFNNIVNKWVPVTHETMPPKAEKNKKRATRTKVDQEEVERQQNEAEGILENELQELNNAEETLRQKIIQLQDELNGLKAESDRIKSNTHVFLSYADKRSQQSEHKDKVTLLSAKQQMKEKMEEIRREKNTLNKSYQERENALKESTTDEKENQSKLKKELDILGQFKNLRDEKKREIKMLEEELRKYNSGHFNKTSSLKQEMTAKMQELKEQNHIFLRNIEEVGGKESTIMLTAHCKQIIKENEGHSATILAMIKELGMLQTRREQLNVLRRKLEYDTDF